MSVRFGRGSAETYRRNPARRGVSYLIHSLPQPSDALTPGIFWLTLALKFGLPLVGWAITLIAMRDCPLTKESMVELQKRIAERKAEARHAIIEENLK